MNFPAFELPYINGGLLIAIIAVLHIFVAQIAVGGGFLLTLAEAKGHRENNMEILQWVQKHTKFFLLVTMVFGGLSGVGIWMVIGLVSPTAVSFLVNNFMYGWATDWAFFLGEILALLLYSATFSLCLQGRMRPKDHMALGWMYAAFAFLSLLAINGIVSFMLTPGEWSGPEDFWTGILNPSFWPALVYRFANSLMLAGLFGMVTALGIKGAPTRERMLRWSSLWVVGSFIVLAASAVWYAAALPGFGPGFSLPPALQRGNADIRPFMELFMVVTPILLLASVGLLLLLHRLPSPARMALVLVVLGISLAQLGAFEWVRETARRPFVIYEKIYSNDITHEEGERMNLHGALSPWAGNHNLSTAEGRMQAGRFLFAQQCSSCHGFNGPMLNIAPRVAGRGMAGIDALLAGQGRLNLYMPPFFGTAEERRALAFYLSQMFPAH